MAIELLDLPAEVLLLLPEHIRNLEDFNNLACTSSHLHKLLFTKTLPSTILQLASRSAPTFFHPHPYFLVLGTARQVADWAIGDAARTAELVTAFQGGIDGLYQLCLRVAGLTMDDIRRLHLSRFEVINPLSDLIDGMVGNKWYATPNFWGGGVSDAFTLYAEVESLVFELLIYGELFGPTMETFFHFSPDSQPKRFDTRTRIEYVKYCVPDWINQGKGRKVAGEKVLQTGPYAENRQGVSSVPGNATALNHLIGKRGVAGPFGGTRWTKAWEAVLRGVMPPVPDAVLAAEADGERPEDDVENQDGDVNDPQGENEGGAEGEETGEVEEEGNEEDDGIDVGDSEGEDVGDEPGAEDGDDDEESSEDDGEAAVPEDANDDDTWRWKLWWNAVTQLGGLEGMALVARGLKEGEELPEKWRTHLTEMWEQISALPDEAKPSHEVWGKRSPTRVSAAPDLGVESFVCCAGLWSGI